MKKVNIVKSNPYLNLLRLSWKYAGKEKPVFVYIYGSFIIGNIITSLLPLLYGWFINAIQKDGVKMLKYAWIYVLAYIGLNILKWVFYGPARVREKFLAFRIGRNFLLENYHQAINLDLKWHKDNHSGALISKIRKANESLKSFFQTGFIYFHALARFVFSAVAILYFSPVSGLMALVVGVAAILITVKFDKPLIKYFRKTNEGEHVVSSTLFDSLSNINTVITLRIGKQMEQTLAERIQTVYASFKKSGILSEWKWFTADILVALIYGIVTIGYVLTHWKPGVTFYVGGIVTLLAYVTQFTNIFYEFAWQYSQIVKFNVDVKGVDEMKADYYRLYKTGNSVVMQEHWRTITIKDLSFSHTDTKQDACFKLQHISLSINRGKKIAIIGESGSGKSTLLSLLRGLYDFDRPPVVLVDGVRSDGIQLLASSVALFPQEPEIFESTIRYNITLGLNFDDDYLWHLCELCNFSEFVKELPNGFDTKINEKGVNLSGGQKQRLALVRGLLAAQTSSIVLMDEPTSSVDSKNELQIYKNIFREFSDKAIISSLHRLYLLPLFDYIYVMDKGVVIAEGSFEYLKSTSPAFQERWEHQRKEHSVN